MPQRKNAETDRERKATTATKKKTKERDPLPGYTLTERIGAGGYGEVWCAEAPGGLKKAIKFVFGTQNEKRATHEYRALQRIKELRHPFLLSLERIEVVDGRLLVVTELADESLKDRFLVCRQQGYPGIPREELVRHLSEAADALDFMSQQLALQHLDIKPENLLMVAGHVKVADFGLVKDVRESQASMVGGMTPLYSAPEVFRGTPSRNSDQYSLAILYQEMLTGKLPFSGATAAELTLQHLNDEPDLSSLSREDRYAMSRALAKNPDHRYESCTEFVQALARGATVRSAAIADTAPRNSTTKDTDFYPKESDTGSRLPTNTDIYSDDRNTASRPILIDMPPLEDTSVEDLSPPEFDPATFSPSPTLLIGIGGTAGMVLQQWQRRMAAKFSDKAVPAVQILLLDTDPKALSSATHGDRNQLNPGHTLHLPLKRPQDYRETSSRMLHWLNRRWLYNMPRSLRTEGIRPLGRLAFADHARQVCQRIHQGLMQIIDPDACKESRESTGMDFKDQPVRVYVVASISGGTGSGMVVDVAYAVKTMLQNLEVEKAEVIGLLLHSTARDPRTSELARVNAFSCLSEWYHFNQPNVPYCGDDSCGLPSHEPQVAPFDQTYLVHLGDGLTAPDFEHAVHSVADYLWLDNWTPAKNYFQACRTAHEKDSAEEGTSSLRSYGIQRLLAESEGACQRTSGLIALRVLNHWSGQDALSAQPVSNKPRKNKISDKQKAKGAERTTVCIRELHLEAGTLLAQLRHGIDSHLGQNLDRLIDEAIEGVGNGNGEDPIGALVAGDSANLSLVSQLSNRQLSEFTDSLSETLRKSLKESAMQCLDDSAQRLAGTQQFVQDLQHHLQAVAAEVAHLDDTIRQKVAQLRVGAKEEYASLCGHRVPSNTIPHEPHLRTFLQFLADCDVMTMAKRLVGVLTSDLKSLADELIAFHRQVKELAAHFESKQQGIASGSTDADNWIATHVDELAEAVDLRLQREIIAPGGGLFSIIMGGGRPRAQMVSSLAEIAHREVQQLVSEANVVGSKIGTLEERAAQAIEDASLSVLKYGGKRRLLAVLPKRQANSAEPSDGFTSSNDKLSVVYGDDNSTSFCVEVDGLALAHIAADLIQHRRDYLEFAKRVHTRSDIPWSDLIEEVSPVCVLPPVLATQMIQCVD
jgi:serine/threonine protein kinase